MNAMPVKARETPEAESGDPPHDGFVALDACHRRMLEVAGELEALVAAVQDGGADAPGLRERAAAVANFYATTARTHHEDEERHLFAPLLASADPDLVQAVRCLQQDHGWLEENWRELEPHVQAIAHGYGNCDIDTLREGVLILVALQRAHIALEESLVYPEARARLPAEALRTMGRETTARQASE